MWITTARIEETMPVKPRECPYCHKTHRTEENYAWCKAYYENKDRFLAAMPDKDCHLDPYYDRMLWSAVVVPTITMRDQFTCQDCKKSLIGGDYDTVFDGHPYHVGPHQIDGEVHHIIERINGGETSPKNLILLCSKCHRARHHKIRRHHSKTLEEFVE
jgi:5-methylcytosine-specific restriction endonuclease McrA